MNHKKEHIAYRQ